MLDSSHISNISLIIYIVDLINTRSFKLKYTYIIYISHEIIIWDLLLYYHVVLDLDQQESKPNQSESL